MRYQQVYHDIVPLHATQIGAPPVFPRRDLLSPVLRSALPLLSSAPEGQACFLFFWTIPLSSDVLSDNMEVDTPAFLRGEPMDVDSLAHYPLIYARQPMVVDSPAILPLTYASPSMVHDPPAILPLNYARQPMVLDSPAILPLTYPRPPMDVDSPALLPLLHTPCVLPPIQLLTLNDHPTGVDPNRELQVIRPATVLNPQSPRLDHIQTAISQPICNRDAEATFNDLGQDYSEPREGYRESLMLEPTITIQVIDPLDGIPVPSIVNEGRLLPFKDYFMEDLTDRLNLLKISDDPESTDPVCIPELPGPCFSTPTVSVPSIATEVLADNDDPGTTNLICIPELPGLCSTPSVPSLDATIATEIPSDADPNHVPASPSFHIFSNLERPFDDKRFTYLSALEGYEPPYNCLLQNHHTDQDQNAGPGPKDWLLGRFGTFGERLKAKMAQRKQKEPSPKTPGVIRTRKTPKRHPYLFDLTPLPSTNRSLASNQDPFETARESPTTLLKKPEIQYKELISDSVFKDLWTHIPSPPPSPTLSWTSSRTERKARSDLKISRIANLECVAEEPIPISVVKTDDSPTNIPVSPCSGDEDSSIPDTDDPSPDTSFTNISEPPSPRIDSDTPVVDKPIQADIPRTPRTPNRSFSGTLLTPQSITTTPEPIRYKLLPPGFDSLPPKTEPPRSFFIIKTSETDVTFLKPTARTLSARLDSSQIPLPEDEKVNNVIKPDHEPMLETSDVPKRQWISFSRILGLVYGW